MKRFRRNMSDDSDLIERLNRDRIGAETVLNQRFVLFLVVFAVVIVSALNSQKKIFFLSLLFVGLIICWVLAYIVVTAARRVGYLVKQIHVNDPESKIADRKGGGRSVRFLLGYFIPIFCSALLTIAFLTGAFGFMDAYLLPTSVSTTAVENKAKEIGSEIKKQLEPQKDETQSHFKSVDSVIMLSKPLPEKKTTAQTNAFQSSKPTSQADKYSPNFKSIDSVIALGNPPAKQKFKPSPYVPRKQAIEESIKPDPHFKSIDSVTVNVKSGQTGKKTKELNIDTNKAKTKKKIAPSPHFENIDSVIAKPK
ncbi:MAG: ATP synthase subunit I [Bacteroidetes bacterium]|nr:ATP synthase subunit I [Bacteroidota bacterium]